MSINSRGRRDSWIA